jgi:E3 ubiquitin-protein ligase DOA10
MSLDLMWYFEKSFPWMIFVVAFIVLTCVSERRGRRGESWGKMREQFRERAQRRDAENQAFREQLLGEMRRLNESSERQNALLAQLMAQRPEVNPPDAEE